MKNFLKAACLLIAFCLAACETSLPPGTVASVNGENISLHSVQALLDSRSASLGIPARPSVSEMRKNYGNALSILITHALVRQDLAAHGIEITDKDLELAISEIKEDFGEVALAEYLAEDFLREEDWRQLLRDQLALDAFTERVLLPSIRVTLAEAREWYKEHAAEFKLPENYNVCYGEAETREALQIWCNHMALDNFDPGPMAQCQESVPDQIAPPWREELNKIKPGKCGQLVKEMDGIWRGMAVVAKNPARTPPLSEVYALVENILLEQKKMDAFNAWLERKLAASKILAAPELLATGETEQDKNPGAPSAPAPE